MEISRRTFISQLVVTAGVSFLPMSASQIVRAQTKINFDAGELIVLSDGHLTRPTNFFFPDSLEAEDVKNFRSDHGMQNDQLKRDCNITLLNTADRTVLFDVGAGANFMSTTGKLTDRLAEAGVDVGDVTDVVLTHAHPDHLWGLVDDFDELAFPNAQFHVSQSEWDYWRDDNTLDTTPENRKFFVVGAQNRFAYIEDQVRLFQFGEEIVPGVEAVDTRGHTPGHAAFLCQYGSASVMVVGDAIAHQALSFRKPDWPFGPDQDQEQGRVTRMKLLARLASENLAMLGFHLPYPGIGFVDTESDHYRFLPADALD